KVESLPFIRLLRRGTTREHNEQRYEREQRTCREAGPRLPQEKGHYRTGSSHSHSLTQESKFSAHSL
ncbi:MAG: hypothetical protein AABZ17_12870, partial [Nitrospirota bacterium]